MSDNISSGFCIWYEPDWDDEDFFETQCKQAYCFDYETNTDKELSISGYNFCPNCGKKIKVKRRKQA